MRSAKAISAAGAKRIYSPQKYLEIVKFYVDFQLRIHRYIFIKYFDTNMYKKQVKDELIQHCMHIYDFF